MFGGKVSPQKVLG